MQGNNSWSCSHQRAMDENAVFPSFQGHLEGEEARSCGQDASEITSLGITSQKLKLTQANLSLLLGCPSRKGFWGVVAAGT